ncbi:major capsid protein [Sigmofec virus UA08Rod_5645]|uniref:Major capsid protein n=1 Tax=Sigmofec virus UA08Rod_5645 TaxID=2929433 RepID=A0A976N0Q8_9VIRU|nr:major capsid protein [Sigmofec virus UA08Rod_5645]
MYAHSSIHIEVIILSRNTNSHFATLPRADISRSTFSRDSSVKLTFNVGDVIPFYVDEVLPGDSFHVETSKVVRMQTLLTPIMDNIYLDTYYFFVPNRLVWEHWREFNGENTQSAWLPTTEYEVPQITAPSGGWSVGTLADYFGIPTGVAGLSVNALPFRAYSLIMNEWFRDENLTDPLVTPTDDATVTGVNTGNYITDVAKGGLPFKAAKYHDYFTSCLPAPQKGPDVTIPVLQQGNLPVVPLSESVPSSVVPLKFTSVNGTVHGGPTASSPLYMRNDNNGNVSATLRAGEASDSVNTFQSLYPLNLWALQSGDASVASINQLRLAFQIQKMYEKDARGGTRYIEILKAHFGVTSPDARLQRPEYLGGNRIPIHINQVIQQSGTTDTSPQGNTAAYSLTSDRHSDFRKSFVEHGFVLGLMVARYDHTYQQGLERFWSRRDRFDYYWPVFANIGEQAVKNKEIYAQGTAVDDEVFGYQEAWADYRFKPSRVCGEMRSQYAQSLDVWHLADYYDKLPSLSDSWIREDSAIVDRVLAVSQRVSAQLFADIYIQNQSTRPMPVYSIPGFIDHH